MGNIQPQMSLLKHYHVLKMPDLNISNKWNRTVAPSFHRGKIAAVISLIQNWAIGQSAIYWRLTC